jgi:autotransporter-associated beta strand protein
VTFSNTLTLDENLTVSTGAGAGDILAAGTINGGKALSLSAGTGAITLSETVGHTTRLGAVTLNSSGATTLAKAVKAASLTTNAGGTLLINGASVDTTGAQSYGEAITLGANTTLTGTSIHTQSTLDGGSNALTIAGAMDMDGAYTNLSSLTVNGTANIGADVTTSGTQTYSGAMTVSANSQLSGSGLSLAAVALESGGAGYTLTLNNTDAGSVIAGVVSGAGGLVKAGAGTLTLNGNNTYAGTSGVSGGTLKLGHVNALGAAATGSGTSVGAGAALDLNGLTVTEPVSLAGGRILNGVLSGAMALTADSTVEAAVGTEVTLSGEISGSFGLTIAGAGTVTLSGNNSFTGETTVSAGTLKVAHANALGSAAGATVVAAGGTLDLVGVAVASEALTPGSLNEAPTGR